MNQLMIDTLNEDVIDTCYSTKMEENKFDDVDGFRCTVCVSESEDQEALVDVVYNGHENYTKTYNIEESDIVWFGRPFQPSDVELTSKLHGFHNRICGTEIFKDKDTQCKILNQCKELYPDEFAFHPGSYCLMKEYEQLQMELMKSNGNKLWIAKPSDGGDGDGIFLFKNMEELVRGGMTDDMVVQQYIGNPLLIRKKKWDSRIYVVVHGINPMKAYISYDLGLGRFCTEDYDTSDTANIFSHLTNYSINRKSDKYVNTDVDEDNQNSAEETNKQLPTKLPMSTVWELIAEEYPETSIEDLKKKVKETAINILRSHRSTIEV